VAGSFILDAYYTYKMDRNIVPGRNPYRGKGIKRLAFQYDPADYTELGQRYRRKLVWLEFLSIVWIGAAPWIIHAGD
jgi:hypothetical protein